MAHVNRKIEIDWMLENYRNTKHYRDHKAAYDGARQAREDILAELREREPEWNAGSIKARKLAKAQIIKEIQARGDEE